MEYFYETYNFNVLSCMVLSLSNGKSYYRSKFPTHNLLIGQVTQRVMRSFALNHYK
jgi:hypothetical protein